MSINAETMAFNHDEAQLARNFDERMSNTAYTRGVADMRNAGLNPILAAGGGGASSPIGPSAASPTMKSMDAVPSFVGGAISSAADLARTFASVKRDLSAAAANRATEQNTNADTLNKISENENIPKKGELLSAQAASAIANSVNTAASLPQVQLESTVAGNRARWEKAFPGITGFLDAMINRMPSASSAFRLLK
jgi:hypothetical protein